VDSDTKYCVVAFIDLLGFSSHLEVSGDLRTSIGQEAVKRLTALDEVLTLLSNELEDHPVLSPPDLFYTRINDALILSMDLSDVLRPSIGETVRQGMTAEEWEEFFDFSSIPEEKFEQEYSAKLKEYTRPVEQFVGLVARIHNRINKIERQGNFPGAKSVVSSGFRRRFISNRKEDILSANFAFSNAYLAEQKLKGARIYVDNNILQLLTTDHLSRNMLKLSCFEYIQNVFSPFNEKDEVFGLGGSYAETEIHPLTILQKAYHFRCVNPNPLTYLQLLDAFRSLLDTNFEKAEGSARYKGAIKLLGDSQLEQKLRKGEFVLFQKVPFGLDDDMFDLVARIFGDLEYSQITVYEKPTCTKCRQMNRFLHDNDVDFSKVNYYLEPLTKMKLTQLILKMKLKPRDLLRTSESIYRELGLDKGEFTDDEIISLMVEHPDLIQRPIVERGHRAVLGRPIENVKALLGIA
jgi:arsenate reductase